MLQAIKIAIRMKSQINSNLLIVIAWSSVSSTLSIALLFGSR
jgi:hypothetical protein